MGARKITKREIIRRALIHAITDREAMIDAYDGNDEEQVVRVSRIEVKLFKEMLAKDYGQLTPDDELIALQRAGKIKTLSLSDLIRQTADAARGGEGDEP